jgi:elongation factor P
LKAPPFVELNIAKSDPGIKGDTVSGATKPAELETGVTIQVPLFVEEGEKNKSGHKIWRVFGARIDFV